MKLSNAQRKALTRAASRERGNMCPVRGANGAAETALLNALDRKGLISWDNGTLHSGVPRINDAGRAAISTDEARS